jgi:type IV secretory pathway TraG/TraD family ATPase VirD4
MKTQHIFKQSERNNPFSGLLYSMALMCCFYLSFLAGTEYVAYHVGLHGFYQPYMWLVWSFMAMTHGANPAVYLEGMKISGISLVLSYLLVHAIFFILRRKIPETDIHGSAKWADEEDLKKENFLHQEDGLYIGAWENKKNNKIMYLKDNSESHVLACAPTASGKGVGLVIPNLLAWTGSVIVFDIKGENYLLTSGYRKNELKQTVMAFNPTSIDKIIAKEELDKIGIDWATFVERLMQAGWAEKLDETHVNLKVEFIKIKDKLAEIFPNDCDNPEFLAILNRPQFGSCACYNPLNEIRMGIHEVKDVQTVVDMIVDPNNKGDLNHWQLSIKSLLTGVILHVLYARKDKSLAGVVDLLNDTKRPIYDVLESMLKTEHDPRGIYGWREKETGLPTKIHPIIASIAREMKNKQFEELSGIVSTANSYISLYRDPILGQNTSHSDFSISDIIKGERPVSLYIIVPPSDLQRVVPLTRLLINQICSRLMENSSLVINKAKPVDAPVSFYQKVEKYLDSVVNLFNGKKVVNASPVIGNNTIKNHKVLLMLDEFPALGKMDNLKTAIAYMRGYGLRAFLICQDLEQLNEKYGENNSILAHCTIRIFFKANSEKTARHVSSLAGVATILNFSKSYSETNADSVSAGASEIRRSLILPDEVLHLPDTDMLLFVGKHNIYGKKIFYYKDPWFSKMSAIKSLLVSDKLPTKNEFYMIVGVVEYKKPMLPVNAIQALLEKIKNAKKAPELKQEEAVKESIQEIQPAEDIKEKNADLVSKREFYSVTPDGSKILNDLIKNNVLEDISATDVKLKDHSSDIKDKIRAIAGDNFDRIINILGLSDDDGMGNLVAI